MDNLIREDIVLACFYVWIFILVFIAVSRIDTISLTEWSELTCFQLVLESFPHLWVLHRLVELSLQDCPAGVALAIDKLDGRATPNIEIILDRFRNQKHRCGL